MAIVKVRNSNILSFDVVHNGNKVSIPAGGTVDMDYEEAVMFIHTPFKAIVRDGMGRDLPEGMQKLSIERYGDDVKSKDVAAPHCPVCNLQLSNWEALDSHVAAMHSDQILQDDEYNKFVENKKASVNAKQSKPASGAVSA